MKVEAFPLPLLQRPDPKEGVGSWELVTCHPLLTVRFISFYYFARRDGWDYFHFTGDETEIPRSDQGSPRTTWNWQAGTQASGGLAPKFIAFPTLPRPALPLGVRHMLVDAS